MFERLTQQCKVSQKVRGVFNEHYQQCNPVEQI